MNKSHLIFLGALILVTPTAQASEALPSMVFNEFQGLPVDIQVKVLSFSDKPSNVFLLNKKLHNHIKKTYMWAKSDEVLTSFVNDAVDQDGMVLEGSDMMKALNQPSHLMLIKRMLWFAGSVQDQVLRHKVRNILTKHVCQNLFFYKDSLIEMSRQNPKLADSAIELARGEFTHGCPMVHSSQMPQGLKEYFRSAELQIVNSNENGIFRVWRFFAHPHQATLTTVSYPNREEYVLLYPVLENDRVRTDGVKILYRENIPRDWPVKEE